MRSLAALSVAFGIISSVIAADPPCVVDTATGITDQICSVRAGFGGSLVVPQVIPSFLPSGILHVQYANVDVGAAQQLQVSRVSSAPVVSFVIPPGGASSGPKYTLLMVDPDAGSSSDILHWMVTDLTVQDNTTNLLVGGKNVANYAGPNPPQGSGTHRYVLLLYTQPDAFTLPSTLQNLPATPAAGSARQNFDLANFVSQSKLGALVGGNFFKATFDGSSSTPTGSSSNPITAGSSGSSASASGSASAVSGASSKAGASGSSATGSGSSASGSGISVTNAASGNPSAPTSSSSSGHKKMSDSWALFWAAGAGFAAAMVEAVYA